MATLQDSRLEACSRLIAFTNALPKIDTREAQLEMAEEVLAAITTHVEARVLVQLVNLIGKHDTFKN